jgi:hypothetical protein
MDTGLYTLRFERLGFSIDKAAEVCHTSSRTYKKWEKTGKFPPWVKSVLLANSGYIFHSGFEGWRVLEAKLHSPEGYQFSGGEIRSIIYLYAHIAELKKQLRLEERFSTVDDYSNVILFPELKKRYSK